jgi:hypothetical protein
LPPRGGTFMALPNERFFMGSDAKQKPGARPGRETGGSQGECGVSKACQ